MGSGLMLQCPCTCCSVLKCVREDAQTLARCGRTLLVCDDHSHRRFPPSTDLKVVLEQNESHGVRSDATTSVHVL
jgi:hypothetical protein